MVIGEEREGGERLERKEGGGHKEEVRWKRRDKEEGEERGRFTHPLLRAGVCGPSGHMVGG